MTRPTLITAADLYRLRADHEATRYTHWKPSWDNRATPLRMIVKSRQVGATYNFAREAFLRACETGHNAIFLGASQAQAGIYRDYIAQWLASVVGVALLGKGPTINIAGTDRCPTLLFKNADFICTDVAQAIRADLVYDEWFWLYRFNAVERAGRWVAPARQGYTRTFVSSLADDDGAAWRFWTGAAGRDDCDVSSIGVEGVTGSDLAWRQVVTIDDFARTVPGIIDVDLLKAGYSQADYDLLFACRRPSRSGGDR